MNHYTHSEGRYRLTYPSDWHLSEDDESDIVTLVPHRQNASINISLLELSMPAHEKNPEIAQLLLEQAIEAVWTAGSGSGSWSDKLFSKKSRRPPIPNVLHEVVNEADAAFCAFTVHEMHWRWWVFIKGIIALVISYNSSEQAAGVHHDAVEKIVKSVKIQELFLQDADAFTDYVLDFWRARDPQSAWRKKAVLALSGSDERAVYLYNLYDQCKQSPDRCRDIMDNFFVGLQDARQALTGQSVDEKAFQDILHSIFPMIKNQEWLEQLGKAAPEVPVSKINMAHTPWIDPLVIMYVIDYERSMSFIPMEWLESWGVSIEQLHQAAIENLDRERGECQMAHGADDQGNVHFVIFVSGDSYDATRILLSDFHEKLAPWLGESFLVAVPNRDFLIAFRPDDPNLLEFVKERVRHDHANQPYPLTERFFLCTPEGIQPYFIAPINSTTLYN